MIQFVAAAAVGAIGIYAWKELRRHMDEIKAKEADDARLSAEPKVSGDLERDPQTGKYRLKK